MLDAARAVLLDPETELDPRVRGWLAFATEKVAEGGHAREGAAGRARHACRRRSTSAHRAAIASRESDPVCTTGTSVPRWMRCRATACIAVRPIPRRQPAEPAAAARAARRPRSARIPQTPGIRKARAALRQGEIDQADYDERMRPRSQTSLRCRRNSGSTSWFTASRNATTWCSTSPNSSTASSPPERLGAVLRHPLRAATDPVRRRLRGRSR